MAVEYVFHENIRWCSNATCAQPFDWSTGDTVGRDGAVRDGVQQSSKIVAQKTETKSTSSRVTCPWCGDQTCARCRAAWHEGLSCDAARGKSLVMRLGDVNKWVRCPRCGHLVERVDGCDHIVCVCGGDFCYRCGNEACECGSECEIEMVRGNAAHADMGNEDGDGEGLQERRWTM